MADLELVLLLLLVIDALALIVLVLIQQGKGADVGAAFGSGSSNTMFGSAGTSSFLTKVTTWLTVGFFAISFGLAYFAKERAAELDDLGIPQVLTTPDEPVVDGIDDAVEADALVPDEVIDAIQEAGENAEPPVDSDVPEL